MMELLLERQHHRSTQTEGIYTILDEGRELLRLKCLELPWLDNQKDISCIPCSTYSLIKRISQKHKEHFHILDVPDRELILIHSGNYYTDIRGCQLPGLSFTDMNLDGYLDVKDSRIALNRMLDLLPPLTTITIV